MTRGPGRRLAVRVAAAVAAVGVVALGAVAVGAVGTSGSSDGSGGSGGSSGASALGTGPGGDALRASGPAATEPPEDAPDRHTGPQGRVGQFVVGCAYSHSGAHDPIVHPGHEGRSHRHDFYGSVVTDSTSSADDLLGTATTCDKTPDTAAYWHPTLYDHDEVVEPVALHAYYRAAPGVDPESVVPMPTGLALIAGDQTATGPQAGEATGWTCGARTTISDEVPTCPPTAPLHLVLTFPDCWDGIHLDSADHRSHVAHAADGACPASHPHAIAQVTVSVSFPISGDGHDLRLASGSTYSAHGDFWNAWDPAGLEREVDACIRHDVVCDLASNRAEDPIFAGP